MNSSTRIAILSIFILLGSVATLNSQTYEKKTLCAKKIENAPKIDGDLSDEAWNGAEIAGDFITLSPYPDRQPYQKTEVRVLYDNESLYCEPICMTHHLIVF